MPRRPRITATHTLVELELSASSYDEIAAKLRDADYHHCFDSDAIGALIDMQGIGVTRSKTAICKSCFKEIDLSAQHDCPGIGAGISGVNFVTQEKKSGNFVVSVGFFRRDDALAFHSWVAGTRPKEIAKKE